MTMPTRAARCRRSAAALCLLAAMGLVALGVRPAAAQTVEDVAGDKDGTVNGATFEAAGQIDGALRFDGVDDLVDLGGVDVAGNRLTLALWVRFDAVPTVDSRFISKANGTAEASHFWMLGVDENGATTRWRTRLRTNGSTITVESAPVTLVPDQWYHVATTYNGSTVRLYVDGTEVGSQGKIGNLNTDASVDAALGDQPPGAGSRPHDGLLDDVRIYSRGLSQAEVQTLAAGGDVASGLQHHWPLDAIQAAPPPGGAYRTVQSGIWDDASTWQRYNGSAWVAASAGPTASTATTVFILNGFTVTVEAPLTADEIQVHFGAQLTVNDVLTLQPGSGNELEVGGTLVVNDAVEIRGASTMHTFTGSRVEVQGTLQFFDDAQGEFFDGSDVEVYGSLIVGVGEIVLRFYGDTNVRVYPGGLLDSEDDLYLYDEVVMEVSGTFVNRDPDDLYLLENSHLYIEDGGVYRHAQVVGSLPDPAFTTWETGSTLEVTGVTDALPGNLNHSFHHLTWNCPGQTANFVLDAAPLAINGDLTIANTGGNGASLLWEDSGDNELLIRGRYVQTGGRFVYTNSGDGTMDVAGDLSVSAGTLSLTDGTSGPRLEVGGDFDLSAGTISVGVDGDAEIELDGNTNQAVTATGTLSGEIKLVLNNASGATLQGDLVLTDDFEVLAGTFDLNDYDLTLGDDLFVDGSIANPDRITLTGEFADTIEIEFSSVPTIPELVVDTVDKVAYLSSGIEITRSLTVSSGTFELRSQALTLKSVGGRTATLFEGGGTVLAAGSEALSVERQFGEAADGWRMLGVPLADVAYSTLNGTFHTQGGEWADVGYGTANLQRLDAAAQDWTELSGADADFEPGTGYIFYMWEDDPEGSPQLPATWTVTGAVSEVTAQSLTFNSDPSDSHNLVGNPWAANLDWDATVAASANVGTSYATWDPAVTDGGGLSGYKYYNSAGGIGAAGPYLPPLTAFSVQATGASASLAFATSSAANDGDPTYFGRSAAGDSLSADSVPVDSASADSLRAEASPHVRLHLEGEGVAEAETYLVFDPAAGPGRDDFDVDRLAPLAAEHATLWFEAEGGRRLAFDGRSVSSGEETYALAVEATRAGTYELSWPDWHAVPDGWSAVLYDQETGAETDLRTTPSYRFRLTEEAARRPAPLRPPAVRTAASAASKSAASKVGGAPRFAVRVWDPARVGPEVPFAPEEVRLAQSYPNPFVASTTFRYGLPEQAHVELVVHDLLGRQVARLVEGTREAGWHTARWEARGLAAGLYLVRLRAGSAVRTGKAVRVE